MSKGTDDRVRPRDPTVDLRVDSNLLFPEGTLRALFEQACLNEDLPEGELDEAWEEFRREHFAQLARRFSHEFDRFVQRRRAGCPRDPSTPEGGAPP